ncbi:hypothetical protein HRI_001867100 [Hibiscus trionum]|uniref:Uncharacterized protein n=1 Tax=Hibiscus trionum TaxID=183268 RepID=A0A9W7LZF3_HIBTR|nr:hypothetical protein HRI_001867100 [Hibiscus trionum]
MLKFLAWVTVLLCTTAVSCRKVEGFPLLNSRDFKVVQGHDIHVWRHAGLSKDEYYKQHQSKKSKGGKGANGGANVPHHPTRKSAAPSLLNPPCFLLTLTLHVIFTLIL